MSSHVDKWQFSKQHTANFSDSLIGNWEFANISQTEFLSIVVGPSLGRGTWGSPHCRLHHAQNQDEHRLPCALAVVVPGGAMIGCQSDCMSGEDPCSFFQTQAAQTVLQSREGPAMPRMAFLLGLMGVGLSGYSSRQLTLHYKPSSHLFRWAGWKPNTHTARIHTQTLFGKYAYCIDCLYPNYLLTSEV